MPPSGIASMFAKCSGPLQNSLWQLTVYIIEPSKETNTVKRFVMGLDMLIFSATFATVPAPSVGNVAERFDARRHGPYPEVSLNRRAAEPGTGRASRGAYVFAPNVAPSVITHRWPSLVNRGARKLHP